MTATAVRPRQRDPDAARMLRVRRGDTAAFAELVEIYWAPVVGRFVRQLGDHQEAEDMAQEVFLRLFRARRRYRARAKFSGPGCFTSRKTSLATPCESRRRRLWRPMGQLGWAIPNDAFAERYLPDRATIPSRPLERAELATVVRAALANLADRQRAALELQVQDRSYEEIADRLAMSPQAAKSLL